MSTKSKTPDVNVKPAELECPHCGRSDWFRFVEAYSTFFGPAEVAVMPHVFRSRFRVVMRSATAKRTERQV